MKEFAKRLKWQREDRHASKKFVAERIDIPYTTYCGYESGAREPNLEMLVRIADFYDVTLDYLLGRVENPLSVKQILEISSSDEELDELLTNEGRKELETYREFLRQKYDGKS